MFFQKTLAFLILICVLFSAQSFAQQKTLPPSPPIEISAALKQNAASLLRETLKDIQNLKAPENRWFFSIEAANLLWEYDEPQARAIFRSVMNDSKQSLAQTAAEVAKAWSESGQEDIYAEDAVYSSYYSFEPELRGRLQKVARMRRDLILALAENDAQTAEDFLLETEKIIVGAKFGESNAWNDDSLKEEIAVRAAKSNPDKAANIARQMLEKEYSTEIITILSAIHNQNADKGSQLAEEIRQKLMSSNSSKTKVTQTNYFALQFFRKVSASLEETKTKPDKKPLLDENSVRELADYLGKKALGESFLYASSSDVAEAIEKYAPEKAAQIRARQKQIQERYGNIRVNSNIAISNTATTVVSANMAGMTNVNSVMQTPEEMKKTRERAQKIAARKKQIEAEKEAVTEKLKQKNLSAEEKLFVVGQIKKFVSGAKRRGDKISIFVYWASESAAGGNAEIAQTLLSEAESLANPQTKNVVDYMSKWQLAEGYSTISPEKSFSILEEIVPPFSSVIDSFVKVGEFVDDDRGISSNGEILIGNSPPVFNDMLSALPGSGYVARSLAKSDFARTKTLIDKFERLEFRMMARMLLLKSLLKPEEVRKTKKPEVDYGLY